MNNPGCAGNLYLEMEMSGIGGIGGPMFNFASMMGLGGLDQADGGCSQADEQDSTGNSMNSVLNKVKMAQSGGIDKASTVLDLLHELKTSDNPALARIGKELCQIDDRIGGQFSGAKQDYLLNQAKALLTAQVGGESAKSYQPQGNAQAFWAS